MSTDPEVDRLAVPLGQLEQALIEEYVRAHGYDPDALADLPDAQRDRLLADASVYASGKLVEVEARSRFVDDMHGSRPGIRRSGLE